MTPAAPHWTARLPNPVAAVRSRFRAWWQARLPRTDTLLLTQRNVYILPTRAGLMFGLTLLCCWSRPSTTNEPGLRAHVLAGRQRRGVDALTHNTLRGLTLYLRPPAAVFAKHPRCSTSPPSAAVPVSASGLRLESTPAAKLSWSDVPKRQAQAQVSFVPDARGRHDLPAISIETRFPLGLFRAWSVWRPAAQLLVYPQPEQPAAPLPAAHAAAGGSAARRNTHGGEIEGIRNYRRGDPLKLVAWKKAARSLEAGGDLVSRDTSASVQQQLWLDWQQCAGLAPEARLSRLAAWVLVADRAGAEHGLRAPGIELAPDHATRNASVPRSPRAVGARMISMAGWRHCLAKRATHSPAGRDRLDGVAAPCSTCRGGAAHSPHRTALGAPTSRSPTIRCRDAGAGGRAGDGAGLTWWSFKLDRQGAGCHAGGGADGVENAGAARPA